MIELIKKVLGKHPEIEWAITEHKTSSYELFYIKRNIEMNRCKDVEHYNVKVYKTFDAFKGSASFEIHPTMTEKEIEEAVEEGIYAAGFVKNPTFELATKVELKGQIVLTNLDEMNLEDAAIEISNAVYSEDKYTEGFVNACEVFVNRKESYFYNSNGVEYFKKKTTGNVEYISTWKGKVEEVELYRYLSFAELDCKAISEDVAQTLLTAKLRAEAEPMVSFEKVNVVFRNAEIKELMLYFTDNTNVSSIYQKMSDWSVGKELQDKDGIADKVSVCINPFLEGSTMTSPYDDNGYVNSPVEIVKDGVIKNLWGPNVFGQYIKYDTKVNNRNFEVSAGSLEKKDISKEPYLEIVSMSGIQVDTMIGSFGGEIRLAIYHDGDKATPYHGGSISGMIAQHINTWKFSKELIKDNEYHGPKYLEIFNAKVLGK